MKIPIEQVERISSLIVASLKEKKLIELKSSESAITERIVELFTRNLHDEEALNRDVDNIMKSHAGEVESGQMDYRKMFNMIKSRLAKEREIIL
ncbi:MAG: DUF507 family protein [Thermodesulfobacteriota bacterium]